MLRIRREKEKDLKVICDPNLDLPFRACGYANMQNDYKLHQIPNNHFIVSLISVLD
jgi:hypothetical protein